MRSTFSKFFSKSSSSNDLKDEASAKSYVVVKDAQHIEVNKIMESLARLDSLFAANSEDGKENEKKGDKSVATFSSQLEMFLLALDRDITNFADLVEAQTIYRGGVRMADTLLDLQGNENLFHKEKVTKEFVQELYVATSGLIESIYWERFTTFSNMLIERWKLTISLTDESIQKAEVIQMSKLFYPESDTDEQVHKQTKKISLLFHPDRVIPSLNNLAKEIFVIVEQMKESLLHSINEGFDSDEAKIEEHVKSAKDFYQIALKFKNAVKVKRDNQQSTISDKELLDLLKLSEQELLANQKKYAEKACGFYRAAIRTTDQLAKIDSLKWLMKQVDLRKSIAICFFFASMHLEAQLYLVGALHLATDLPNAVEKILELQALLAKIVSGKGKTHKNIVGSGDTANPEKTSDQNSIYEEMSTALTLITSSKAIQLKGNEREKLKQKVREATSDFLVQNTIRADTSMVEYHAPEEAIVQVRKAAAFYTTAGVVLKGGGAGLALAPLAAVGVSVAAEAGLLPAAATLITVSAAAGPVGIATAIMFSTFMVGGGFILGWKLSSKADDISKEPERQQKLNEIMNEATSKYKEGKFEEMFEALGRKYVDEQLLVFEKGVRIEFPNPSKPEIKNYCAELIRKLLSHGFRCDGVALVLHMISEALICADLRLQEPQDRRHLREKAVEIIIELERSDLLNKDAETLDQLIYANKSKLISKTTQSWENYYRGLNASDFKDAKVAPFKARLNEIRMISKINKLILYIIDDKDRFLRENVQEIKNSIHQNFQYFSASLFRLDALEDFLTAKGIFLNDQESETQEKTSTMKKKQPEQLAITNQADHSKLLWGNESFDCYQEIDGILNLNPDDLLALICTDFISGEQIIADLSHRLQNEKDQHMAAVSLSDGAHVPMPHTIHHMENFFRIYENSNSLNPDLVQAIAVVMKEQYNVSVLLCQKLDKVPPPHVKQLFGLTEQEIAVRSVDWNRIVFIAKDLSYFFRVNAAESGQPTLSLETAAYLQLARNSLSLAVQKRNLTTMTTAIKYYNQAVKYFQSALSCFDSAWNVSMFSLYQFREFQAITNSFSKREGWFPSRMWKTEEVDAIIGLMECYCGIFRYAKTLELVVVCQNREEVKNNPLFWYWYAVAARKSTFYYDAIYAIQKSLDLNPRNPTSIHEKKVSQQLNASEITGTVQSHVNSHLKYDRHRDNFMPSKRTYSDIISIDGGGIKGLIPAYWIAEIEKRTHAPIAKLVRMIAGTSTGSIIAGALATPLPNNNGVPIAASTLANLYCDGELLKDVFSRRLTLLGSKYHDHRRKVIEAYVHENRLKDTLVDLLIPAVDPNNPRETHCFSSFHARASRTCNHKLVDAIMASSAAPTYFDPYRVEDTLFVDGGMQANNPAKLAYDAAIENGYEHVRLWSFGTGDYIAPPTTEFNSRLLALKFWATNAYEVAVANQQGVIDKELSASMGNSYNRWQVWLHNPITLDSYYEDDLKVLVEHARQFIEEADASDDNPINKCCEALLENNL